MALSISPLMFAMASLIGVDRDACGLKRESIRFEDIGKARNVLFDYVRSAAVLVIPAHFVDCESGDCGWCAFIGRVNKPENLCEMFDCHVNTP